MKVVIFSGPTISTAEIRQHIDAVCLPPASQGDVYRAALTAPDVIAIVDGYFHHVPAVWHKEILWALAKGIRVFGAASIGALRAVELERFGMIGVGAIFEAFRSGELEDDDEVAVLHGPPETGFQLMTDAMVDIRVTLQRAVSRGIITEAASRYLVRFAKSMHYSVRCFKMLLAKRVCLLSADDRHGVERLLREGLVSQKRADAMQMLQTICAAPPMRPSPGLRLEHTVFWDHALATAVPYEYGVGSRADEDALDELRISGRYRRTLDHGRLRHLALTEAIRRGLVADESIVEEMIIRFRRSRGLHSDKALHAWLAINSMTAAGLRESIREEALLTQLWCLIDPLAKRCAVDHLKIHEDYGKLSALARRKRDLAERGPDHGQMNEGFEPEVLLRRHRQRLLVPDSLDAAALAAWSGFDREAALFTALRRERMFEMTESRLSKLS